LQDLAKFTQIWIFGLKTNHLATLHQGDRMSLRKVAQKRSPTHFLVKINA
jgi:hypothetical protein